jgi:hypothetical protein
MFEGLFKSVFLLLAIREASIYILKIFIRLFILKFVIRFRITIYFGKIIWKIALTLDIWLNGLFWICSMGLGYNIIIFNCFYLILEWWLKWRLEI